jgi:uncharacterized protein YlxW (UPF0749 family)
MIISVDYHMLTAFSCFDDLVRIMKMKQAEQQRDSVAVQHVEALKQKVMKLRKENESLKRRLASSELDCS